MSEKWLLSRCEGYEVRIDEVSAKLQAPVIERCTEAECPRKRGFPGVSPGPLFRAFLAVQKGTRTGVRNILV